jgi:dTMP kinase
LEKTIVFANYSCEKWSDAFMRSNGRLITFEGIDGCGKTTQIRLLSEKLSLMKIPVETREPRETWIGKQIRKLVLSCNVYNIDAMTELFLFCATRTQHYMDVIKPSLLDGKIVISDRFIDTTIAYQGFGRGIDHTILTYLHNLMTGNLLPDLTFFLDLPPDKCRIRCQKRHKPDRIEKEKLEFLERVYNGFITQTKREPNRIKCIDTNRPIGETEREIWEITKDFLKRWQVNMGS